ncbi:hypothetical protein ACFL59_03790 [Planctomycetota bacterium]
MANAQNTGSTAGQGRLDTLKAQLDTTIKQERGRLRAFRIVGALLLIFIAGYLSFLYAQLAKVDADVLAAAAQSKIMVLLPEIGPKLSDELKARAPDVVADLQKRLLEAPVKLKEALKEAMLETVREEAQTIEDNLYQGLSGAITSARSALDQQPEGTTDEEKFKSLLDNVIVAYKENANNAIEGMYKDYSTMAREVEDYLVTLNRGTGLDERQQVQRELVQTWLAIVAREQKE